MLMIRKTNKFIKTLIISFEVYQPEIIRFFIQIVIILKTVQSSTHWLGKGKIIRDNIIDTRFFLGETKNKIMRELV